jgi:hypothetical protein
VTAVSFEEGGYCQLLNHVSVAFSLVHGKLFGGGTI